MHTKTLHLFTIGIAVAVAVYGFFLYRYNLDQVDLMVGNTVSVEGTVVSVNTEQAMYDGPYLVVLQPEHGAPVTIAVPSMGLPFCPAYKERRIGDVTLVQPGQEFEARGEVSEHQTVVPCESPDHYFRPKALIVSDFEGEADPRRMKLDMKKWRWISATYNDGRLALPKNDAFSITFGADGKFSVTTDCNSMGGSYVAGSDGVLTLSEMFSTKMYCQGSQETEFAQILQNIGAYHFTSKGELILDLKFDSGTAVFK